jgi:hypothetical protein
MFLLNTWNKLPESYQQRVYKHPLAAVKRQIQQAVNPTPAVGVNVEAVGVDNAILLDYLTSEVALEELEIGTTDQNIAVDNNCTNDELHFGMPADSGDYKDEGNERDEHYAIPTGSRRRWPGTELERFDLGTCDVDGYEVEDGDDADEEEEASHADDGSTQNAQD